jgi:hypothetical protein
VSSISVKSLAEELGSTVPAVSLQVSALCMSWGPLRVVEVAAGTLGGSLLSETAADEIRSLFALAPAGAA